jgi:undecaprenyl-diphosphatase
VIGNEPALQKIKDPLLFRTLVCIGVALLAFLVLAALVTRGVTQDLDVKILREVRKLAENQARPGHVWAEESVIAITSVGATTTLVCASCVTLGFLVLTRKWHTALVLVLVLSGAGALNQRLKPYYGRSRPDAVKHVQYVETPSFPSGHALLSTSVYGTLGAIGISLLRERRLKIYLFVVTTLLVVLIGLSRIYLGVHYPSDVLAGWILGAAWSLACWLLARHFARADRRFGETSVPDSADAPMQARPSGPTFRA